MNIEDKINAGIGTAVAGGVVRGAYAFGISDYVCSKLGISPGTKIALEGISEMALIGGSAVAAGYSAKKAVKKFCSKCGFEKEANVAANAAGIFSGLGLLELIYKVAPSFVRGSFYDTCMYGHWFNDTFRDYIPAAMAIAGVTCIGALIYGGISKLFK